MIKRISKRNAYKGLFIFNSFFGGFINFLEKQIEYGKEKLKLIKRTMRILKFFEHMVLRRKAL